MYRLRSWCARSFRGFARISKLGFFASALLLAPSLRAQSVPNDNFANATVLTGDFGTVTGSNVGATAQPGEPNHSGIKPNHSVWYSWTASSDGPVEFDTFNSSPGFDTVLAVYTGTQLANLDFLVGNDDVNTTNPENADRPGKPNDAYLANPYLGPSGVKFNAKRGTTYYLAVDGTRKNNDTSHTQGSVTLSWAYNSSGVFRLSHSQYICTEAESARPVHGSYGASARGARITINRLFGSSGKAIVSFDLADGLARLGADYNRPDQMSVIFDNNETSKSFLIPIRDDGSVAIRNPARMGAGSLNPVRGFTVTLTDVALDPLEDASVLSPPRFDNIRTSATVSIYDLDMPAFLFGGDVGNNFGITNGVVTFERSCYRVSEGVGVAHILVYRSYPTGGALPITVDASKSTEIHYVIDSNWHPEHTDRNNFDLQAGSDYAAPTLNSGDGQPSLFPDFGDDNQLALDHTDYHVTLTDGLAPGTYGTLVWGAQGDFEAKSIWIPIVNDNRPEFNEDLEIQLYQIGGHANDAELGACYTTTVTILHDDSPAGALDDSHNRDFDLATDPPRNSIPGADDTVQALIVQPDNKTIIGGHFASFNSFQRYGVARMNVNGSIDRSFDPGSGVAVQIGDFISSLALQPNGQVVIGGSFDSFDGTPRYNIAQLNSDGSLDTSFNPGLGADGTVWAVVTQPDGKVLVGGEFTSINGFPRAYLARLNVDGSVDTSFDPGANKPNGAVRAIVTAPDGSFFIGGDFTFLGDLSRNSVAKLDTNGVLVTSFNPGTGADGPVYALGLQSNGKLLLGGAFAVVQFRSRNNMARLNADGTLDLGFDPGTGANDAVYSITVQSDDRSFFGGPFTAVNGTRRIGVARLLPTGEVDTSFLDTAYNQFAGPHKPYFNPYVNPKDFLMAMGLQSDGNLMIGGSFGYVGGGRLTDEVVTNSAAPCPADRVGETRASYRIRHNVARLLGGDTEGPGSIGLVATNYTITENMSFLFVKMSRTNGTLGEIEAAFSMPPRSSGPGVAQSGVDYAYNRVNPRFTYSWRDTRALSDGLFGTNNGTINIFGEFANPGLDDIYVSIPNRPDFQGDRNSLFRLDMPSYADVFYLGGENIPIGAALGLNTASLGILEDDVRPGVIGFSSVLFTVNENGTNALVTLTRTNGSHGLVSVRFATTNGTAIAGIDYFGVTNTITFGDGVTNASVVVPIKNDSIVQNADKIINLYLANPGNGATLGLAKATLAVIDDDFLPGKINFASSTYTTDETSGSITLVVTRSGGNLGVLDVQFATSNLTATASADYLATNALLHWDDKDTSPRYVTVQILHDGLVNPNKQFTVGLFSPSVPGALGGRPTASVTILNTDAYGKLSFSAPTYRVNENGGYATITVIRTGGSAQTITADFATANATAFPFFNYVSTNRTLVFGPGEVSQSFTVPIINDGAQNPSPFFFTAALSNFTPNNAVAGNPTNAVVNIIDAQGFDQPAGVVDTYFDPGTGFNDDVFALALQPDGRILAGGNFTTANGRSINRIARLFPDGSLDLTFLSGLAGVNGPVRALVSQTDTRVLIGGAFSIVDGVVRNSIARLNYDGSLDSGFNPGSAADGAVYALAETFVAGPRKLLAGGSFNTFNGRQRAGIIRLNDDGSVDGSFLNGNGANGTVFAVAAYPTNSPYAGRIVIGGDFTAVNGVARNRLARLNQDGSVDDSFDPGQGADDAVRAIVLQSDGRVLVGGRFTHVNGASLPRIARLNGDGSVDASFQIGLGAGDVVHSLALQVDNRIVVGGEFTTASGVTRSRITRLMPNGTVDSTINFGTGADNFVASIAIQPDGMLVVAGGFTQMQGLSAPHIARIYGGSMVGSGSFRFDSASYQTEENRTNILITILREGGTSGPLADGSGDVSVTFSTSNGTALAGVNFSNVVRLLTFPRGETRQTVVVPVIDDQQITPDLSLNLALSAPTPPAVLGPQPTAVLTILNVDSVVRFSAPNYSRAEDAIDGAATIQIVREGGTRFSATVDFTTTINGTATPGVNYTPVTNTVTFGPGETEKFVKIPLFHTPQSGGDTTVTMQLSNPAGTILGLPFQATLTIIDVDEAPGQFAFSVPAYIVGEGDGSARITILRTNGHSGVVSVAFSTVPGTATPGLKYIPTNSVLTFIDGEVSKSFLVRILEENQVEGNQTLSIVLANPTGGATLYDSNTAPLTIVDNDIGLAFENAVYAIYETNALVTLNVFRAGGTNEVTQVAFSTANGTAAADTNYSAASGILTFNRGEFRKSISVSIRYDSRVTGNLTFTVNLSNPTGSAQLSVPNSAVVSVLDVDSGLRLGQPEFTVLMNGTNVVIPVLRTNANTGTVLVNYATADGTAIAGQDYSSTSGTLVFINGQTSNAFIVPISSSPPLQGDKQFTVSLFNPTQPAQLLVPASATVNIIDNLSRLRFSSPVYNVTQNGVAASITVERTGFTNSTVGVTYLTHDGTARQGVDYLPVAGSLVFTNGETIKTFSVPITDNNIIQPDKTILLGLANPIGFVTLAEPSSATLTIHNVNGSLVVPAGSALVSESLLPANGVIEPGETVTLLFALRDSAGTNTANLLATLLSTNGITAPGPAQNYGSLQVAGPSASRPFTFTASGTNGQRLVATLLLQDGGKDIGTAIYTFTLGSSKASFVSSAPVLIRDLAPLPAPYSAAPYPAILNVSGVDGQIGKVTVTISNLNHSSAGDVGLLLVSPAAQTNSLLMVNAGGNGTTVSRATLTFDDSTLSSLPQSTSISSGTYKPTVFPAVPQFPSPAPLLPYGSSLSAFNGVNPNGDWSLYVIDDSALDSGGISNGWSLTFTTVNPILGASDLGLTMAASPNPVVATSNLVYSLTVSNYGPSAASNVVVSDSLPVGASVVSSSVSQGSVTSSQGAVSWVVPFLSTNGAATLTLIVQTPVSGVASNFAKVTASTTDLNPDDDTAAAAVNVLAPSADLVMSAAVAPNSVLPGGHVTFTYSVFNVGPATASGVMFTNRLPSGFNFVALNSSQGAGGNYGQTAWANLGSIGAGAQAEVTLVAQPVIPGTFTNTAAASSPVLDLFKANNTAAAKVLVIETRLSAVYSGNTLTITWPDLPGSILETATNLVAPVVWTPATDLQPVIAEGQRSVTVNVTTTNSFFRFRVPVQ